MDRNKTSSPASRWVFYHARFNRDVLVSCVESLLLDPDSAPLMHKLIDATTMDAGQEPAGRGLGEAHWFNASKLKNLEPRRERLLVSFASADRLAGCEPHCAINLSKMFELMPSAVGNFELAAVDSEWQLILDLIYSLAAATSFLLNTITMIVLWNCRRGELRKYLINLSLSDVLMSCFSLPFTYIKAMHGSWLFPRFLCPVSRFLLTLNVFVSVATMAVISINRHSAIMNPLKRNETTKIRHWRVRQEHVIIAIWLLGIVVASPIYLMYRADMFCYNNRLYFECHVLWSDSAWLSYVIIINVSTFVVPLSLLSYFYTRIALKLWQHTAPGNQNANRDSSMQTQRIKTVKMLLMMVVAFVVTWLPIQTVPMVMYLMTHRENKFGDDPIIFYVISHWLSMAHSCCNPLIYCFMSEKFRTDLRRYILMPRDGNRPDGGGFLGLRCFPLDTNQSRCRAPPARTSCRASPGAPATRWTRSSGARRTNGTTRDSSRPTAARSMARWIETGR